MKNNKTETPMKPTFIPASTNHNKYYGLILCSECGSRLFFLNNELKMVERCECGQKVDWK